MSNKKGRVRARWEEAEEEVEEMLRAAQDDLLLKLTLNSHLARSSSSLNQDVLRRFEALKSPSDSSKITSVPPPSTKPEQKPKEYHDDGFSDDLLARFSALRNSSSSSSSSSSTMKTTRIEFCKKERSEINDDDDEEDEVSKVIQWAIDEARLNPSSFSSDDEEETNDDRKTKPSK